jgi:hypothetical protein
MVPCAETLVFQAFTRSRRDFAHPPARAKIEAIRRLLRGGNVARPGARRPVLLRMSNDCVDARLRHRRNAAALCVVFRVARPKSAGSCRVV